MSVFDEGIESWDNFIGYNKPKWWLLLMNVIIKTWMATVGGEIKDEFTIVRLENKEGVNEVVKR